MRTFLTPSTIRNFRLTFKFSTHETVNLLRKLKRPGVKRVEVLPFNIVIDR